MKLPNKDQAIIPPEKLQDYVLPSSHPVGKFKAAFFQSLGYTAENWQRMEADIRSLLENDAKTGELTEYGQKFEVRGQIVSPSLRTVEFVTAWIVLKNENIPRYITAYPGEK
ncbi:DUF6883 domain-containing protein [Methylomicrobium lacus]|uniref:DUF6883 domain-containing protein n=1 Tax=Methylomicrobium lacus TaxID=136992 RepID=UPI0035A87EB7